MLWVVFRDSHDLKLNRHKLIPVPRICGFTLSEKILGTQHWNYICNNFLGYVLDTLIFEYCINFRSNIAVRAYENCISLVRKVKT